jgi:serine-type D-Ala-D-Ala carboxypeptidase (penicillin-binding protein 5/6)
MKDSQFSKQNQQSKKNRKFKLPKEAPHPVKEKKKIKDKPSDFKIFGSPLPFFLILVILFFLFFILVLVNNKVVFTIEKNKMLPISTKTIVHPYPFIQAVQLPDVSAKSAIIIDADSQVIIFSKNPRIRFSMASTAKIMTALVALDYFQKDSILTVNSYYPTGSHLGLHSGERFYFEDLLYALLLPSANDAAQAIADNYPGGVAVFVEQMNAKASEFHLRDTHFADPTGLDDDGNYTTVTDLARLASMAMRNAEFAKITGTKNRDISNLDKTREFELANLNKLLGIDGVNGIKTGTTEAAGEVLVTSTVADGHTFIVVVMNSRQRFVDTKTLLRFIVDNVKYISPDLPSAGYSGELNNK